MTTMPKIDWQCDDGICEHTDRVAGDCACYNKEVGMTKRFYIDAWIQPFNGKLSIDVDAGSEKQAWEKVRTMLGDAKSYQFQLKTTSVVNLPWQRDTSDD